MFKFRLNGHGRHRNAIAIATAAVLVAGTTVASAATSSVGVLAVSAKADRSAPQTLAGSTLKGNAYIFINRSNVAQVTFSLDGKQVNVERVAPFDLATTAADGTAKPLATTTLTKGVHKVVAVVTTTTQRTRTYSAQFTVDNSVPNPTTTTTRPTTTTAPPTTTTTTTKPTTTTTVRPTTTTTTTPPNPTGWPGAANTGVPDGLALTTVGTGSVCYLDQPNAVYDAKRFNCDVLVQAGGIKITRSMLNGRLISNTDNNPGASVVVQDSTIDGGQQETFPSVSYTNITLTRVEVIGGQHSVQCSLNCTVEDSWLHAQYLPRDSAGHVNAFISNGGSGFVLRHNTLDCSADPTSSGGCTADASFFGDFGPISNVSVDNNFFVANHAGYCLQAGWNPGKKYPNPTNVRVTNNVFQRVGRDTNLCGIWGPYTAFDSSAPGAVWSGNKWDTGEAIN